MAAAPTTAPGTTHDRGLTDPLDGLLGDRAEWLLALVDRRAGIRVDALGVELRTTLHTQRVRWEAVERLVVDSRVDAFVDLAVRAAPLATSRLGRLPLAGSVLSRVLRRVVRGGSALASRALLPTLRRRAGTTLATFELRRGHDVDVDGAPALLALLDADVTRTALEHAAAHGIPVVRR